MQIINHDLADNVFPATLHLDLDLLPDVAIQNSLERNELGDQLAIDADKDVASRQLAVGRRVRNDMANRQHIGLLVVLRAGSPLCFRRQAEASQFIKRLALKRRLQGTA